MSYAWLIVAECERGRTADADRLVQQLAAILPGFTRATPAKLFEIFPEPTASKCIGALRSAGLIPVDAT